MKINSHRILNPRTIEGKLYLSFEIAFMVWICFMVGRLLSFGDPQDAIIGGLWCAISAIVVLQNSRKKTKHFALVRILGSFIGAFVSGLLLFIFGVSFGLIIPIVFIIALICKTFNFEEGMRLSVLTAAIVFAVCYFSPDVPIYLNSTSRFIESLIGTTIAVFFRWLTFKTIVLIHHYQS